MEQTFSFGKNWNSFLKNLNDERVRKAECSLKEFLNMETLQSKSFLDIGCGSGLFSYAAYNLGAEKVVSFDIDPLSVRCCQYLHEKARNPSNWKISEGSICDETLFNKLGTFDIVYSWGVLHHTGQMWKSIENSARLVNENGYYHIAIYNRNDGIVGSKFWAGVKKTYNQCSPLGKVVIEGLYMLALICKDLLRLKNPIRTIRQYQSRRGMRWMTDVRDWLGGYPFEYASVEEIFRFVKTRFPRFELQNIKTTNSALGLNWFLFKNHQA